MTDCPIFDATLADAPVNIWQASNIFPQPIEQSPEIVEMLGLTEYAKQFPALQPAFTDWAAVTDPRYYAKVTGHFGDVA